MRTCVSAHLRTYADTRPHYTARPTHPRFGSQEQFDPMETKITVLVSEDLRRQAKATAALHGRTLSDVVRELLESYVDERLDARLVIAGERSPERSRPLHRADLRGQEA